MLQRWNFILGLLFVATQLPAQINSGVPFIHNYGPVDYKQGTQNFGILKDRRGILYVGNNNGVLEFDGNQFSLIPVTNRSEVHSLAMDSAGTIYVGGQGDFGFLEQDSKTGRMHYVSLVSKLENAYRNFNDIWSIHITPREVIFRSTAGLYIYRDDKIIPIPFKSSNHRAFYVNGVLYVREENFGLRKLVNDTLVQVPEGEKFLNQGIYGMLPISNNRILVLTSDIGFFHYDGQQLEKLSSSAAASLVSGQINFCEKLSADRFAIATRRNGIIIIDSVGNIVSRIDKSKGLQDNSVWHVFQDEETKDLWVAENNGFSLVELSSPFTMFGKLSGLDGQFYNSIKQGDYLYTAGATGVYYKKLDDPTAVGTHTFQLVKGLDVQAWHFYQDSTTVLVATNRGIFQIEGEKSTPIGFDGRAWYFIPLKKFPGYILVNTADGLILLKKEKNVIKIHSVIQNQVASFYVFTEDSYGNIWADNPTKGIFRIEFKQGINKSPSIALYNSKNGLPSDLKIRAFPTKLGVLFGTEHGIYRFDQEKNTFYPDEKLNNELRIGSDFVELIKESPWGDIGVVLKRNELDLEEWRKTYVFKNENETYEVDEGGFQKINTLKIYDYLFIDKKNIIISTSEGIIHYNSTRKVDSRFDVLIRRMELLRTDSTLLQGNLIGSLQGTLPFALNNLRFTIACTDLRSPEAMQYQYLLEGADGAWSPWTSVHVKEYTNLMEGSYTLHVRAKNQYNQISGIRDFSFSIAAPWYRTYVAYASYVILGMLLLYFLIVLQARNLKNDKANLEKLVDERTLEIKYQNLALEKARETIANQVEQLKTVNVGLEASVAERTSQLQFAYDELLALKNELDTFIYRSSHDINGPLMRLRGLCRTAIMDVSDEESRKYFRLLDLEVDVMARMLQKLIFFYNIKNSEPKKEEIRIRTLIDEAITRQQYLPGYSQIKFEVEAPIDMTVLSDSELLLAATSNVLENAVLYRTKEKAPIVKISAQRENGTLQIAVRDNGLGIDTTIADKVFNMFFRGTERSSGAGLGLFIATEAIKKLKGGIHVDAKEQTTFTISVPVG